MSAPGVVLIALASLLLSAVFSGAETGFMTVSRVRLQRLAAPDAPRVRALQSMLRHIEGPVLTCLVGTNLATVTFTAIVTAALSGRYREHGELLSVLVSSVIIILLGEIAPKVLFREFPERLTLWAMPVVAAAAMVLGPVRWALLHYTALWRRILPSGEEENRGLDRRSLAALMLTNSAPNTDDRRFADTLDRFLHLAGYPLTSIMRPLEDVVGVPPAATVGECLQAAARSGFSRLPLLSADPCRLPAYVLVRDLIFLPREDHRLNVPRHLWRPFLLVDERMSPYEVFEEMRGQGTQVAVVVDTRGNPLGLLTLEDLLETVIGSVRDEFDITDG